VKKSCQGKLPHCLPFFVGGYVSVYWAVSALCCHFKGIFSFIKSFWTFCSDIYSVLAQSKTRAQSGYCNTGESVLKCCENVSEFHSAREWSPWTW